MLKLRPRTRFALLVSGAVVALTLIAQAQGPGNTFTMSEPSTLLDNFKQSAAGWTTQLIFYANRLFTLLLLIEFTYSAITHYLQHQDLQGWMAAMLRKVLSLGAFYVILVMGPTWIPAIIDSLQVIGQNVGAGALAPDTIVGHGFNISLNLVAAAKDKGFLLNAPIAFTLLFVAVVILFAYIAIAIQFILAKIESYLLVSAGILFLGFGGSRWTSSYTERYIGGAVASGIKLMVLYLVIALGDPLAARWIQQAQTISLISNWTESWATVFSIATGVVIFAVICWTVPKLVSAIISGSPSLGGADLVGAGVAGAGAIVGIGAVAAGGTGLLGGGAAAGGSGGGAASASQAAGTSSTFAGGSSPAPGLSLSSSVPPPALSFGSSESAPGASQNGTGHVPPPDSNGSSQPVSDAVSATDGDTQQNMPPAGQGPSSNGQPKAKPTAQTKNGSNSGSSSSGPPPPATPVSSAPSDSVAPPPGPSSEATTPASSSDLAPVAEPSSAADPTAAAATTDTSPVDGTTPASMSSAAPEMTSPVGSATPEPSPGTAPGDGNKDDKGDGNNDDKKEGKSKSQQVADYLSNVRSHIQQSHPPHDGSGGGGGAPSLKIDHSE